MKYAIMFILGMWFHGQMALGDGLGLIDTYDSQFTRDMVESHGGKNTCIMSTDMYLKVVQKMAPHIYEVVGYAGYTVASRGIVKIKGELGSKGFFRLPLRYMGAKKLPMQSGFDATFGVWEEC